MNAAAAIDAAARRTAGVLLAAAGLAAALWLASGITTVEPGDRGVVLRWGAVDRVVGSGLILAWPRPIESIVRIPGGERTLSSDIARFAAPPGLPDGRRQTAGLLTGDAGLVHLSASVAWTVAEPADYVTAARGGDAAIARGLERAFASAAIAVCAGRGIDGVLVVGSEDADERAAQSRERLRGDLLAGLNARLDAMRLGIRARRVDLGATLPEAARPAFAEVLSAAQSAERQVAEARAAAERQRQEAALFRAQRLGQAEAAASELVSRARVSSEAILALAGERDPSRRWVLLQRVWRERLEPILRKVGQVTAVPRDRPLRLWLGGGMP